MLSQTNEQALEAAIEKKLTGTCVEELKAAGGAVSPSGNHHGYEVGSPNDFDSKFAIDTKFFWKFLEETQKEELEKLQKTGGDWQRKVLERFDRLVKKYGILYLLKKGLSVDNADFVLMYPAPLASSAEISHKNFAANIFSCTRQVRYSNVNAAEEIDVVLFLNGLPFATLELKNSTTGQNARYNGTKQYKEERDASQPLLNFARCLVHMAVDTNEVYMTTKLAGKSTFFLPFNKGNNDGAGNPLNPKGHKSAYLWEEVFSKKSVANIIQHFMRLDGSSKDRLEKRTLFFPRYHQLDVVRKLIDDVCQKGTGQTYLIQHSAGSGKSNSITWTAYQLIEAEPVEASLPGARAIDEPLFDSVIVVTDRRILDRQLRTNIKNFSEVKNIVAPAYTSADLKKALEEGKKIIITTIQKFPVIVDTIDDLSDKRFAVIIDEAHSSQSGLAADKMNSVMGGKQDDEADAQDLILKAMQARKMRGNASYFAFTATPKNTTLEKFGTQRSDGDFEPFHLYSMKQAIEEGFILDVLANYTTYKSYYEIQKSIEDNPLFDRKKAQKKLRAYVERHRQTIQVKAEIMLEHFIKNVVQPKKLKGKARGMIVTQSIESAIGYYKAISKLLDERGNPFKAIISFSGTKEIAGIPYSQADMNGFSDDNTEDYFNGVDKDGKPIKVNGSSIENTYRLLIVANKYLTGFDQPKLSAMYVDKKLQHVLAVQALSRLNRSALKLGKKTEDLFVLDFFNAVEEIKKSFDPFYTSTSLSGATDVNVLHELKDQLDEVGVYEWYEVESFNELYFKNADYEELTPIRDIAVQRFDHDLELEEEEKADFKIKAKQFVKIYGQMAAILPFEVLEWEKLFWFLKFLIPELKVIDKDAEQIDELLESVDLSTYALERVKIGHSIELDESEAELDPQNPNPRGVPGEEKVRDPLDEIIKVFNERYFDGWSATPEEQRERLVKIAEGFKGHPEFNEKYHDVNDEHHRDLAFKRIIDEVMSRGRDQNIEFYKLYYTDDVFRKTVDQGVRNLLD